MKRSNFILLEALLLVLVCGTQGEVDWYDPDGEIGHCIPSEKCHCQFTGSWSVLDSYFELRQYPLELNEIEDWAKSMNLTRVVERATRMYQELDAFEARIQNMSVEASLKEYAVFEKRVENLEKEVDEILRSEDMEEEILYYGERLSNVSASLDLIWSENPFAAQDDLNEKVIELTGRLSSCQLLTDGSYFRGDSLPLHLNEDDWCNLYEPEEIGDSLTHGTSSRTYGNWFKDPLPNKEVNITNVWFRDYISTSSYSFVYAQNYSEFIDILAQKSSSPSVHNVRTYGMGYMMYNGSLYYHYNRELFKYTLSNGALHKIDLDPAQIAYYNHFTSSYTFVDIKADEYGLYLIYTDATNDQKMIIRKINHLTLETIDTWYTNKHKATVCATFMICGKLYTLDNCWSRLSTGAHHHQYTFDTRTGKEKYENWHLTSKFGHIVMVGYNPRERLLFAWDNAHLVTYPITWKRKTNTNTQP